MINFLAIFAIVILFGVTALILIKKPKEINKHLLWVYIPVFIVGFILHLYVNTKTQDFKIHINILRAFFSSVKMFAFSIDSIIFTNVILDNLLYSIALTLLYLTASFSTALLIVILVHNYIRNQIRIKKVIKKKHYIVIGDNEYAFMFVNKMNNESVLITEDDSLFKELISKNINVTKGKINEKTLLKAGILKSESDIIIIEGNDIKNLNDALNIKKMNFPHTKIYANYEAENKTDWFGLKQETRGDINFFSLSELIVQDFIINNPLVNYLKPEYKDVNGIFLGFGNTNKKILRQMLINNQFEDTRFEAFVFDQNMLVEKERFIGQYYALWELDNYESSEYYEKIDNISKDQITFDNLDILSYSFKSKIINLIKDYSFIVVALGSDKFNAETALELNAYLKENNYNNYHIFVKLEDKSAFNKDLFDSHITYFGDKKNVLSKKILIDQELDKIAKKINALYLGISLDNLELISEEWNKLGFFEKESNRYAAYNIDVKLSYLGLTKEDIKNMTEEQYLNILKPKRNKLNEIEHNRWNAFYIMNNFLPMKKSDIYINDNGKVIRKNIEKKRHACLTTMKGLHDLELDSIRLLKEKGYKEDKFKQCYDVIEYDYLIMDYLHKLLRESS